jgi:hypothetical protein
LTLFPQESLAWLEVARVERLIIGNVQSFTNISSKVIIRLKRGELVYGLAVESVG